MTTCNLQPFPKFKATYLSGTAVLPLVGGKLYSYAAGTTTPLATYTDYAGGTPNANPTILDSNGEANIWYLDDTAYKLVLKDSLDATQWTVDNIQAPAGLRVDLANTADAAKGDALIGVKFTGTGGVARTQHAKNTDTLSVQDFGAVGDGTTDDTVAIQAAIDYAIAHPCNLIMNGVFKVKTIVIKDAENIQITGWGAIIGFDTAPQEGVLVITDSINIQISGKISVSANFLMNYESAVRINGSLIAYVDFNGVGTARSRVGFKIGSTENPDSQVSEITIRGSYNYACPCGFEVIGANTVVCVSDFTVYASYGEGTATAWLALPLIGVTCAGALVNISGGECLLVANTTGKMFILDCFHSPAAGNIYGTITATGCVLESASPYAANTNTLSLGSIVAGSGLIQIIGCEGYHSQLTFPVISTTADYTGRIVVTNCNFYCAYQRTIALNAYNVTALNDLCNIYVDDHSFGKNFLQGLQGITGGNVHYGYRVILHVGTPTGQAIAKDTNVVIKWQNVTTTEDSPRFASCYNATTGVFTVPANGLKDVFVTAALRTSKPEDPLYLFATAGTLVSVGPMSMGGVGNIGFVTGAFSLGNVVAGTEITVTARQVGKDSVTDGGASTESMYIYARN